MTAAVPKTYGSERVALPASRTASHALRKAPVFFATLAAPAVNATPAVTFAGKDDQIRSRSLGEGVSSCFAAFKKSNVFGFKGSMRVALPAWRDAAKALPRIPSLRREGARKPC